MGTTGTARGGDEKGLARLRSGRVGSADLVFGFIIFVEERARRQCYPSVCGRTKWTERLARTSLMVLIPPCTLGLLTAAMFQKEAG
ncbi:hypothetical protein LY78DRAFT_487946 [Colletotrichum sublineola]|nr:hypothetical protein LY78DRAFT_487946 [Colletotrichum sublineola]